MVLQDTYSKPNLDWFGKILMTIVNVLKIPNHIQFRLEKSLTIDDDDDYDDGQHHHGLVDSSSISVDPTLLHHLVVASFPLH